IKLGNKRRQFGEKKGVGVRAHAEEHVPRVLIEVALMRRARKDRHDAGDAAAAGDAQNVLAERRKKCRRAERPEPFGLFAFRAAREEPLGRTTAGLALDYEFEPPRGT